MTSAVTHVPELDDRACSSSRARSERARNARGSHPFGCRQAAAWTAVAIALAVPEVGPGTADAAAVPKPAADRIFAGCKLDPTSDLGLRTAAGLADIGMAVVYTLSNPNDGQKLGGKFTGPVICTSVAADISGPTTEIAPVANVTLQGVQQSAILAYRRSGAVEKRVCHTTVGEPSCLRIRTPAQPASGVCALAPGTLAALKNNMKDGGITQPEISFVVVHALKSDTAVTCIDPSQVSATTDLSPGTGVFLLTGEEALIVRYTTTINGPVNKRICHTAAGNSDCYVITELP